MRTKFVHVLLEEQWAKVGRRHGGNVHAVLRQVFHSLCGKSRQFRLELVLYLIYLVGFAGWCITGRASCADPGPPEDEAQDFNNLVGLSAALAYRCLAAHWSSAPFQVIQDHGQARGGHETCLGGWHGGPQKGPPVKPVGLSELRPRW